MNMQQGLDSLLHEVETVLSTGKLHPQRQQFLEGGRYYLSTLKAMMKSGGDNGPRTTRSKPGTTKPEPPG